MLTLQHCLAALTIGVLSIAMVPALASKRALPSAAATGVRRQDVTLDGHTFSFQGRTNERGSTAKVTPFVSRATSTLMPRPGRMGR